jgi:branched-chain amino acid transport system permease protein
VIYLENVVSLYTERWPTILGVAFIVIMIFAPEGILGKLQVLQRRWWK